MKKWFFLGIILCIAILFRFWQLGNVPYGFLNDEVVAIYNADTLWQTHGYIVDGSFLPLNIHGVGNDLTPVPVYIDSIFLGVFGMSPFVGRLPYALAGVGSVIILFLILDYLTKNNWISLGGAFAFAVSPWHIVVSRGAWESVMAIFFYLLGTYIFLKTFKKGSTLWSLPVFFLAFYSYNADKFFFVFFIIALLFWYRKNLLERKKELLIFICGLIVIIGSFFWVLKTSSSSRSAVLLWESKPFAQKIVSNVQTQILKSTAPLPLSKLYLNKPLEITKNVLNTYLIFFSPEYLFLIGDTNLVNGYGIFFQGEMYLIELPFLLLGIIYVFKKNNSQQLMLLIFGVLAAPIASALTFEMYTNYYFFRSNIAIPFLSALVGCGIYSVWKIIKNRTFIFKLSFITLVVLFYGFLISKFIFSYYFQFATTGSNFWLSSTREVLDVVRKDSQEGRYVYMGTTDREFILQYAFFAKVDPRKIQKVWRKDSFTLNNVSFGDTCELLRENKLIKGVYIVPETCNANIMFQQKIIDKYSLQTIWKIYEN